MFVSHHPNRILALLRDLVPLVQFKKREKQPWRRVTFSKVAGLQVSDQ